MPTRDKPKKPAAKRRLPVRQKNTDAQFPGLVRDSVSGLLVRPLAPGQKPVALSVIKNVLCSETCLPMTIRQLVPMALTLDEIVEETRALPHDVVNELINRILIASHGGQAAGLEEEWSEAVHRRLDEIRSGAVTLIPGEETSAKIRRIVGR